MINFEERLKFKSVLEVAITEGYLKGDYFYLQNKKNPVESTTKVIVGCLGSYLVVTNKNFSEINSEKSRVKEEQNTSIYLCPKDKKIKIVSTVLYTGNSLVTYYMGRIFCGGVIGKIFLGLKILSNKVSFFPRLTKDPYFYHRRLLNKIKNSTSKTLPEYFFITEKNRYLGLSKKETNIKFEKDISTLRDLKGYGIIKEKNGSYVYVPEKEIYFNKDFPLPPVSILGSIAVIFVGIVSIFSALFSEPFKLFENVINIFK